MTDHFETSVEWVLKIEGGYSDRKTDSGGKTMYGISQRAHPELWANGPPTREAAKACYRSEYWNHVCGDELAEIDPLLALAVFQAAVLNRTAGPLCLQLAVGAKPDGSIGPQTLALARVIYRQHYQADVVLPAFLLHWLDFLTDLAMREPKDREYHLGWTRRTLLLWPRSAAPVGTALKT